MTAPYPTYTPSPEEEAAVRYCQHYGAPANVQYLDVGYAATAPASQDYHETWFTSTTGAEYKCDSKLLVANPNASVAEMDALQMLRGQPNGDPAEPPPLPKPAEGFHWVFGYSPSAKAWGWVLAPE